MWNVVIALGLAAGLGWRLFVEAGTRPVRTVEAPATRLDVAQLATLPDCATDRDWSRRWHGMPSVRRHRACRQVAWLRDQGERAGLGVEYFVGPLGTL